VRIRREDRRQPKVEHLHGVDDIYFDVGGLEVSVDNTSVMGRFKRIGNLARKPEHVVERQPTSAAWVAVSRDPIVERFTIDEFHDERRLGA
jgi:hypothetical protein